MLLLRDLPLVDGAEYRFDVDNGRSIDRFEAADVEAVPVNVEDPYPMQANRIRTARCPGTEDTSFRPAQVSTGMHPQDAAVGLVQPSQQDDLVASSNAVEANLDLRIQDQACVRRALITLPRRVGRRSERTLHTSYRADCEVDLGGVGHGGTQSQLRCRERVGSSR